MNILEDVQVRNAHVQQKLAEFFKKKKADDAHGEGKGTADQEERYLKLMGRVVSFTPFLLIIRNRCHWALTLLVEMLELTAKTSLISHCIIWEKKNTLVMWYWVLFMECHRRNIWNDWPCPKQWLKLIDFLMSPITMQSPESLWKLHLKRVQFLFY